MYHQFVSPIYTVTPTSDDLDDDGERDDAAVLYPGELTLKYDASVSSTAADSLTVVWVPYQEWDESDWDDNDSGHDDFADYWSNSWPSRDCLVLGGRVDTAALERRLAALHAGVDELVARYQPTALAVEDLYFGRNVQTAMAVGQARGVVLAAAGARSVPCFSYTPQQVKQAVCGTGAADKGQVQRMVAALLSLPAPPEPDHAADALAVAICHLHRLPTGVAIASAAGAPARATVAARKTHSARREVAL
ncbi:MAG: crossover junction endodeoxyribonuclease RuvC [Thermoleophilum sp.]|nr:crossover junction endodeoxyribonuclease RuvC [Thermoleophilum sp.]